MAKLLDPTSKNYLILKDQIISLIKKEGYIENDKTLLELDVIRKHITLQEETKSFLESVLATMVRERDGVEFIFNNKERKSFYLI